jgi:phenylpropionate dioxygenase-like ring-hydroxylating dioxygenase large terminal subunit
MGRDLVFWRSGGDGEIHCWLDLCIHRGAKLSLGVIQSHKEQACLICPYHGWRYAESGQCVSIPAHPDLIPPAKARAETFVVRERYGVIWVCFGEPGAELPDFPIADDPDFRLLHAGPYRFRALGPRLIENLLDVAHLGIVHAGLLGDPEQGEIEDYEVEMGRHGPEAKAIRIWQPNPDGTGAGALVAYHYEVQGPLTANFVKLHGSQRFGILAQVLPVDEEFSEMRMVMALNYGHEISDAELVAFQDHVAGQDKAIVESQRPELLPLDLQAELHLRSDRMAIAYRKWLRSIGFTYGVA